MSGILRTFNGTTPTVASTAFVADTAVLIGDVTIEEGASIWYGVVLRGDIAPIVVHRNANVQDNVVGHVDVDVPLIVGEGATVGHSAVLHGCTIGHHSMVGMHATVLTGATVGDEAVVAAAALVPENRVVPARSLSMGVPARVVRLLADEEIQKLHRRADDYIRLGVMARTESEQKRP
ncbi:gamma carbonic anhydrase family protein [Candidatus Cryosericum hinesii]|jgi:carbonic anhydrase/acetyltransferase-like protein (isoleucine patch superfamily)|uniref:Gamma carbonic anhydrase family protein n=1 Tax=Candidatus Cryosericum hinesii TaxID=2290915 RepID=A0A398DFN5_9BACT|nr:gamma carbonic anhydrase family protein [Candidatus Cryosericum hinesii]RIE10437.1 gamma carbonic anhydrase family protein [Candidatus Cryosericum hinesii]RIE14446.1 gamma carbonic anhydrase family protein [Candidatus Cryosericum hinesii]RIE14570.1 gamma carbonic anhydrase family protein [Candidatus Cryosericum hinesii]